MATDSQRTAGNIKPVECSRKHEEGEPLVTPKLQETAASTEGTGDTKQPDRRRKLSVEAFSFCYSERRNSNDERITGI